MGVHVKVAGAWQEIGVSLAGWISGATGGTEDTFVGDGTIGEAGVTYKRHTFTADGTFTNPAEGTAEVILIGGGAAPNVGTNEMIGAGGAGGVFRQKVLLPAGALDVRIGAGGIQGYGGSPTSVGPISVPGGGVGGKGRNQPGGDGGSGGGGGDGTGAGGKGVPGVGNNGGNGGGNPDAGGGGGAGGPGVGPAGGPGVNLWGTTYAAGGSVTSGSAPAAVVPNSGNGGGNNQSGAAGNGSSGKAFIFYPV